MSSEAIVDESCSNTVEPAEIAHRLVRARQQGGALTAFPGAIPATLADAYGVQDIGIRLFAQPVEGWKVGRILPPQSDQFGADRLAGPIFTRSISYLSNGAAKGRVFAGGFGAAEAELLLRVGRAPMRGQLTFSLEDAAALIDRVHVGLEIASSPMAAINELGPPVIVSDFGNNNGLVVGPEIENWREANIDQWPVTLLIDGHPVGTGSSAGFPDGAIGSARFLFELLARRGIVLAAGTWISSGALTGVHPVQPGQSVEARFGSERVLTAVCTIEYVPRESSGS